MKIKTHSKQLSCVFFILALLLSGSYCLFNTTSIETYALDSDGSPDTLEEFEAQLDSVREKRDEIQKELDIIKEYESVKAYQEVWEILDRYVSSETIGAWAADKLDTVHIMYWANDFSYDETFFNELVSAIQKYDPSFKLADDIKNNNIVSSIPNISVAEIATVTYDMLYLGHIDFMLANTQTHFDKNAKYSTTRELMVDYFLASVKSNFVDDLALYTRMAELYNRVMSRETFTEAQTIFQQWYEGYYDECVALRRAMYSVQHGEAFTTKEAFPYYVKKGAKKYYFDWYITLETPYTLEQFVKYLPSHSTFPTHPQALSQEDTIAYFTTILETKTQELKETLLVVDPTLDLDNKTADELLEVAKHLKDLRILFAEIFQDASPEAQELASLLIQFYLEAIDMLVDQHPADDMPAELTLALYDNESAMSILSASQFIKHASSSDEILSYYHRIGNAALYIDPTVTQDLYPYSEWVIPDHPATPNTPNTPGSSTPDKPSDESQDSTNSSDDGTVLTPNTGVSEGVIRGVTSTIGLVAFSSVLLIFCTKKIFRRLNK